MIYAKKDQKENLVNMANHKEVLVIVSATANWDIVVHGAKMIFAALPNAVTSNQ